jgi:hypothetical protein
MAHAREAFESGGELTYEEVIALRREIVGNSTDREQYGDDTKKYREAQDAYLARERDFGAKLARCRLRETVGWVAWWSQEYDKEYNDIPDKHRLHVYLYDPFHGAGKELRGYPEMDLAYLTDEEVAQLKYGQRIKFSGDLMLLERSEAVWDPQYEHLADEPAVPTPTAAEMQNLRITLDRTMCNGSCPDYTLTIEPDGKVTFQGESYTKVKGAATGVLDGATLTEIATEIKKADFFSLDESYIGAGHDSPTYTLTVEMNGRRKEVSSFATSPRRLDILMDRIDQIVNSAQWIGEETYP